MDHVDRRINRSLKIHDLENLVYQKRQRKCVQPLPLPSLKKKSIQKKCSKKSEESQKNASSVRKESEEYQKKKVGRKPLPKKPFINEKQVKNKIKRNNKEDSESYFSQSAQSNFQVEKISPKKKNQVIVNKLPQIKRKNITTNQSQTKNQKKTITKITKTVVRKYGKDQQVDFSDQNINVANIPIKKERVTLRNKESSDEGQERDSKISSQIESPQLQQKMSISSIQNKPQISNFKQKYSLKPQIEVPLQRVIKQQIRHNIIINRSNSDKIDNTKNTPYENNQPNKSETDLIRVLSNSQNPRSRKAKMNPIRKYNDNDCDQDESQESYQSDRAYRRKKKILKNYRRRNKNGKPYSLNRIFRKQVKLSFPTFQLNVDLNKLSIPSFVNQFGSFDLIHFSLPISYLHLFPDITHLIQKGFIFVWVEKGETQVGYHLLNRWGFDIIDQIIWIKSNQDERKIEDDRIDPVFNIFDEGEEKGEREELFINMKSTCLVGYKCPLGNKAEYRTKVANNIIFANSLGGISKPEQIYQIADLMMPGAKKLQFGGKAQKGWLNLKHHQKTLFRCNTCLGQRSIFLMRSGEQLVQCKRCLIEKTMNANSQAEDIEQLQAIYRNISKIKIDTSLYLSQHSKSQCSQCGCRSQNLQYQGFIVMGNDLLCSNCIIPKINIYGKLQHPLTVACQKRKYFHQCQMGCTNCKVLSILDVYFECIKCKNHIICKDCFWKIRQDCQLNIEEEGRKIKKQVIHQWKLKFVKSIPLMKFSCFGCRMDLTIPFWCCQTCQNWAWCGRCDRGHSDTHPHYQNGRHNQYVMM